MSALAKGKGRQPPLNCHRSSLPSAYLCRFLSSATLSLVSLRILCPDPFALHAYVRARVCVLCVASPSSRALAPQSHRALSPCEGAHVCSCIREHLCMLCCLSSLSVSPASRCVALQLFQSAMPAHVPSADALASMVTDIVERNVDMISNTAVASSASRAGPSLRPIQSVAGQAFPAVRTGHSYGRQRTITGDNTAHQPAPGPARPLLPPSSASARVTGFSAHVQPQDATSAATHPYAASGELSSVFGMHTRIPEGATEPLLAAGGSAQQRLPAHQWSIAEFEQLRTGYYVRPVKISYSTFGVTGSEEPTGTRLTSAAPSPSCVRGEAFFSLLFQCIRSTVRRHQQLALEALLAHLHGLTMTTPAPESARRVEAEALRDRCLHGPNCAPFIFFVLEILVSAGHPAVVEMAGACLLLLLRGLARGESAGARGSATASASVEGALGGCSMVSLLMEAVAELGSPAGDAPEEGAEGGLHDDRSISGQGSDVEECRDDPGLPFSEVSELLRGPDARLGLEQLGFTNKVLRAMHLLLLDAPPSSTAQRGGREEEERSREDVGSQVPRGDTKATAASPTSPSSSSFSSTHSEVLFLELLLCGGVGAGQRAACRRVAEDPAFLAWAEAQLSAVVLGRRRLEDITELLCVLQHLSHVPSALHSVLRGSSAEGLNSTGALQSAGAAAHQHAQRRFYETWHLFFLLVCSTNPTEVRTVRHASAILWSMLILRACALPRHRRSRTSSRAETGDGDAEHSKPAATHSRYGIVQDVSDTLLAEGMYVGGGVVMEMWLLQYTSDDATVSTVGHATRNLDHYFLDAARTALHLCRSPPSSVPSRATTGVTGDDHTALSSEATAAQRMLGELRWAASAHFFSTYIARMRQRSPAVCYALCGTAVETEEVVQLLLQSVVMDTGRLTGAFARFTSPLLSASLAGSADGLRKTDGDGQHRHTNREDPASVSVGVPTFHAKTASAQVSVVSAIGAVMGRWLRESSGDAESTDRAVEADSTVRDRALLFLCLEAASLHANTRLAAALGEVYPAVAVDMVLGYAALLVHAFEEACLRVRDGVAVRIQIDELCTMAEAVQLLQRLSTSGSSGGAALSLSSSPTVDALPSSPPAARYAREARIGAFFLLHSVAVSKHCLDAVPLLLPLLQLCLPAEAKRAQEGSPGAAVLPVTTNNVELAALMSSLRWGIELTSVPAMLGSGSDAAGASASSSSAAAAAVSGAPRCWALYPLFDASFAAKYVWANWLRGLLGLHQRAKDVLGWDGVLCHVLLWTLAHRRELWGSGTAAPCNDAEAGVSTPDLTASSAVALCELMVDLCAILQASPTLSAAASRTLEIALAAYSDAPCEEGMPLLMHALLAYVAAHCSARTTLAALQVLLVTPVLQTSSTVTTGVGTLGEHGYQHQQSGSPELPWRDSRSASATAQVCAWLRCWAEAQGRRLQSARGMCWSLDEIVSLVQLVGPRFRSGDANGCGRAYGQGAAGECGAVPASATEALQLRYGAASKLTERDPMWCARCLTDGLLQCYLQQRIATSGGLSMMEKAVIRSTLEDLDWHPAVLRPLVESD
ncbi:hypothetical protein LSCM4_03238 [Leishmania orientalis]|uniref:Uncharacterized protein n=1 Tax=Leishmania orientalis TaxID=2249476 RepID=A0A836H659_9TRYP|nr:hypothetical protein LSCM4_03238 [Leishmania orientalis]